MTSANWGNRRQLSLEQTQGFALEVRNTGRFNEQIIGIGYGLHQREGYLESLDPLVAKDLRMWSPE